MNRKTLNILFCLLFVNYMYSQRQISGIVTDNKNTPLKNVSVLLKGTLEGTITNSKGEFYIEIISDNSVLVFSFIGKSTKQVKVNDLTYINVVLNNYVEELDEVLLIGYDKVSKKDLTGSAVNFDLKRIEEAPVGNLDEALTGRVSGVEVISHEGVPGDISSIVVRGGNSLTSNNNPLFVVNGIPLDTFDFSTLSSEDILSITVLKDASATAIYGSRGANGVVVIKTIEGEKTGKTTIKFNQSTAIQRLYKSLKVLKPYDYVRNLELLNLSKGNWDSDNYYLNDFYEKWGNPQLYKNVKGTNWQDEIFRDALMTKTYLSLSTGNDKSSFYLSTGILDQEGIMLNSGFKKWTNNLNFSHKINDKLSLNVLVDYAKFNKYGAKVRYDKSSQIIRNSILFRPVEPLNRDEGEQIGGYIPGVNDEDYKNVFNPVDDLENTENKNTQNNIRLTGSLKYNFLNDIYFKSVNGYSSSIIEKSYFYGENTFHAQRKDEGISAGITNLKLSTKSTSNTIVYNNVIKNKAILKFLFGLEAIEDNSFQSSLSNTNIPTDRFGINNIGIAEGSVISNSFESKSRLLSYFSRINLDYNDKYFLTSTFRADGSSKFPLNNKWGYFPSVGLAWKINNENFLKRRTYIDLLKLRLGWGITGNNKIGDYSGFNTLGFNADSGYAFNENENYTPGLIISNLAYPSLKWETTKQTDLGLDLSLFNSRISSTIDYYYKVTTDLLLNAETSLSTGFNNLNQNIGSVSNTGLEIAISTKNIQTKNFKWSTNFNISTNRNKIIALNDGQESIKVDANYNYANSSNTEYHYISKVGEPVGMMYGFEFDGLYQAEDFNSNPNYNPEVNTEREFILKEGIPFYGIGVGPGHLKYKDQNNDGVINQEDRIIIGNPHPKHFGGITNTFKIYNIDVSIFLNWAYEFNVFNATNQAFSAPNSKGFNSLASAKDVWTPFNTNTVIPTYYSNRLNANTEFGMQLDDRFIEDGSYLKLNTVSIGYNLSKKLISKMGITKFRIGVSGQNLYKWTNYSGYDPSISISRDPLIRNLDYAAYPKSRTVSLDLLMKF